VIDRLVAFTNSDGLPFSDDEIAVQISTLLVAGGETLPKSSPVGCCNSTRIRDQREALVDDPSLVPQAFEEMVRLEGVLQFVGRTLTRDAVVGWPADARWSARVAALCSRRTRRARIRRSRRFLDPSYHSAPSWIRARCAFLHRSPRARLVGIALLRGLLARYPDHRPDRARPHDRRPSSRSVGRACRSTCRPAPACALRRANYSSPFVATDWRLGGSPIWQGVPV
jgi:hypothetical protein